MDEGDQFKKAIRGGLMAPNMLKIERFLLFVADKASTLELSRSEKMMLGQVYHHAWWYRNKILKTLYPERKGRNEIAPFVFPKMKSSAELYLENLLATNKDMHTNLVVQDRLVEDINKAYDFLSKQTAIPKDADSKKPDKPNTPRFPYKIPSGTTWESISMSFSNDDKVEIRVGKHAHTANFADMGFSDGRKIREPNKLWTLLKLFAMKSGSLPPSDPDANDKYKKQKQLLADRLKEYFSIDYDPFKPYSKKHGYAMKMVIFMEEEQDTRQNDRGDSLSDESASMFSVLQGGIE